MPEDNVDIHNLWDDPLKKSPEETIFPKRRQRVGTRKNLNTNSFRADIGGRVDPLPNLDEIENPEEYDLQEKYED